MTDREIDALRNEELEVTYAERVLGYEYRPGKTQRKPWFKHGFPALKSLPHFLGWDSVVDDVNMLTTASNGWPFLPPYCKERLAVTLVVDPGHFRVKIDLHLGDVPIATHIASWEASGALLGEAFLRAMLKAGEWFRQERGWEPGKRG